VQDQGRFLRSVEILELRGWDVAEGLVGRSLLNQATHSTMASSSCDLVLQTRSAISSVLKLSTKLSAIALMLLCQERDGLGVAEVGEE
jgi:hypothetical protein